MQNGTIVTLESLHLHHNFRPLGEARGQILGHPKKYDKVLFKVSPEVYISVTTYQKSFIFGPQREKYEKNFLSETIRPRAMIFGI